MKQMLRKMGKGFASMTLVGLVAVSGMIVPAGEAVAETRYITDVVYVPMRAGPGNQYRIVHQGLRTGLRMKVLEVDAGNGFSKVVTDGGLEGFVRTQYLLTQEPARERLPKELERIKTLTDENSQLKADLGEREKEVVSVQSSLSEVSDQLDEKTSEFIALREATADPQALERRNKQLMEENLQLKNRIQVVEADNAQLLRDDSIRWYLYGGGTIIIGILFGLFLPMVRFKKKVSSDWV